MSFGSKADSIELVLIGSVSICVFIFSRLLPNPVSLGEIMLGSAILIFVQSLLRDLWIRFFSGTYTKGTRGQRFECMCMESTVGVSILLIGIVIAFAGLGMPLMLPSVFWPLMVIVVCLSDYLIKDMVIDWKTGQIRRDPNHANLIFW